MWMANAASVIVFPVWILIFFVCFGSYHEVVITQPETYVVSALVVLSVPIHEYLHYLAIRISAPEIQVRYGIKPPLNPYVALYGGELSHNKRFVFLLAPFVIITALCVTGEFLLPQYTLLWIAVASTNASGSITDMARTIKLLKQTIAI